MDIGGREPNGERRGIFLAKATFLFDSRGSVRLDDESPLPLYFEDQATPLGVLPRDDVPRRDDVFEVFLLGSARAPRGEPVREMRVHLSVGGVARELVVHGDRHWVGEGESATISDPVPFTSMPVSWDRAFGGSAEVEVDHESFVDVSAPSNERGRGFDAGAMAASLDEALQCPPGYPKLDRRRWLPNVEVPGDRVTQWGDVPVAEAWDPREPGWALYQDLAGRANTGAGAEPNASSAEVRTRIHHRAHPAWVLPAVPPSPAWVELEGFSPEGRVTFEIPEDRFGIEYILGERTGTRWATPHALILLPDDGRFVMVHRLRFVVPPPIGAPRRAVVRTRRSVA